MCCYGMNEITAGILAGGKSSRMGENKVLLPWEGSTFLLHLCSQFEGFGEILVSVEQTDFYKGIPYKLIEDVKKGYGPLEGLYQIFSAAQKEYIFVAAVDMPFLNQEFITAFIKMIPFSGDCIITCDDERWHPLCGIYKRQILPVIERMQQEEKHSMQQLLKNVNVEKVHMKELGFSEKVLSNINTKEEYKKACRERKER